MSRDYKSKKSNSAANGTSGSLILGLFIGYALGLVSAIGIWMYVIQAPTPFLAAEEKSTASQPTTQNAAKTSNEPPLKSARKEELAEDKDRFDFYRILPGIEESVIEQASNPVIEQESVAIIEQESDPVIQPLIQPARSEPIVVQQQTTPPERTQTEQYFLQAGSFRTNDEAENLKARLALLGVVSAVQSANLSEKGTWHRVRIGPFIRMAEVEQVRASLQQNGIETQFIKVGKDS
ncbi:MAG: SPOR domain-containing protein [Nitrosomonas sp.]|nr:SPOR domain-containing protein [Nitrosomonas sp.]MDP1950084.1 SPOR domain-containing protein [Nitrosomonas sp.]